MTFLERKIKMLWPILFIANTLCSILCYLTNWIVVLFADKDGELHGIWKLWQTWDDSLDVDWFVKGSVPRCFRYDFDKHYESYVDRPYELARLNRSKGAVRDLGVPWSIKERLQRYVCRVLWLTRNCGYGFAFWWFGANHTGIYLIHKKGSWYDYWYNNYYWEFSGKLWVFEILAGWKLNVASRELTRSMIAGRIIVRLGD